MDDDDLVRDSLGQMLESLGYRVDFAIEGNEALDSIRNAMASGEPFDVVIMDLTIPGGRGGKDTIEELNETAPDVKAIVTSGYSNDPIMAKFGDYGFNAVLTKPYKDIVELSVILDKVIKDGH
jgi:CheY-like chemotaxis protein